MNNAASAADLTKTKRLVLLDGSFVKTTESLTGGVVLAGLALHVGADPLTIGLIASLPFLAQVAHLPAVPILTYLRNRRTATVVSVMLNRSLYVLIGSILLWHPETLTPLRLLLLVSLASALSVIAAAAWNYWMRDSIPKQIYGSFFARRFRLTTFVGLFVLIAAGATLEIAGAREQLTQAFGALFFLGGLIGIASVFALSNTPHRPSERAPVARPILQSIYGHMRARENQGIVLGFALVTTSMTLALPLSAAFLIAGLGYSLLSVAALAALSMVGYASGLKLWGHLADRTGNKPLLQISVALLAATLLAWALAVGDPDAYLWSFLALIHYAAGISLGGIELTTHNLLAQTAPADAVPTYMASLSLIRAVSGATATIAGGAFWQWTQELRWGPWSPVEDVSVTLRSFHVLCLASAIIALFAIAAIRRLIEEGSQPTVDVAKSLRRETANLSSVAGLRAFVHVVSFIAQAMVDAQAKVTRRRHSGTKAHAPAESPLGGDGPRGKTL